MAPIDLTPALVDALVDERVQRQLEALVRKAVAEALSSTVGNAAPKFERPEDFARRYKICQRTVRTWLKLGLPHVKQGRAVRIDTARADAWLADDVHGREIEARAREDAEKARATRRAG
jgi:hypothetical protein